MTWSKGNGKLDIVSSKKLETRQKLLQTALDLLEKGQGSGVRMVDIASAAGVSRQTLYLHFGSRAELLVAVTRYLDDQLDLDQRYRHVAESSNASDHLDAFVSFWGEHVPLVYSVVQALWKDADKDGAAAAAWDDRMEATRSACAAAITAIESEGVLDPAWTAKTATDFLFSQLSIRNWALLTRTCGWSHEDYVARQQLATRRALFV